MLSDSTPSNMMTTDGSTVIQAVQIATESQLLRKTHGSVSSNSVCKFLHAFPSAHHSNVQKILPDKDGNNIFRSVHTAPTLAWDV